MARWLIHAFTVLALLLPSACIPPSPSEKDPPPTAIQPLLPTPSPTAKPAPTQDPLTAKGQFDVKNTSPDMPEVLVEAMDMVFEYRLEQSVPWQTLAAACDFDPAAPVLVRETQAISYDCQLERAVLPGAELRATVEIRLFGSDQIFRLQVQQ